MNKLLLRIVAFIMVALSLPVQAQEAGGPSAKERMKPTMDGVWQLCMFQKGDSGKYELRVLPVVKSITADGKYQILLVRASGAGCGIAEQGSYVTSNDTILTETPMLAPHQEGEAVSRQSVFHLQGPQWMVINRTVDNKQIHEIWMRLRHLPNASNIIEEMMNNKGDNSQEGLDNLRNRFRPNGGNRPNRQRGGGQHLNRQNQGGTNESPIDNSWMNED